MLHTSEVILGMRKTEKGARIEQARQYVLKVAKAANKIQIKEAAEALFKVTVVDVNTLTYRGKWQRLTGRWGRRPDWKKAIVTLAEGQKIEVK